MLRMGLIALYSTQKNTNDVTVMRNATANIAAIYKRPSDASYLSLLAI